MKQNRRLQGSYATKENPFKHKPMMLWVRGKTIAKDYYNATLF
jgi:hypothetical protein